MPNVLDSFKDPHDDFAYSTWVKAHTDEICEEILQGKEKLARVTEFVKSHLQTTAGPRLDAGIRLLQRAIVTRQSNETSSVKRSFDDAVHIIVRPDESLPNARQTLQELQDNRLQLFGSALPERPTLVGMPDFSKGGGLYAGFLLLCVFMDSDPNDYGSWMNAATGLQFMIASLQLHRNRLPDELQPQVDQFLDKLKGALAVKKWMLNIDATNPTEAEFQIADSNLQQSFLQRLNHGESLYLASGWSGYPGHYITLQLIPRHTEDGRVVVSGQIQNRGAGLQFHEMAIKGNKIPFDPNLNLGEIPIEELSNSSFLSVFLQLQFANKPRGDLDANASAKREKSHFSEKDFYHVFLNSWPGSIAFSENPIFRIAQRGPNCTLKPHITEMKALLGEEVGNLAKYYFAKDCWDMFITQVGVTEDNVDQMEPLLEKLARRTLKLKMNLQENSDVTLLQDFNETIDFCTYVRKLIATTKETRSARLAKATVNLDSADQVVAHVSRLSAKKPVVVGGVDDSGRIQLDEFGFEVQSVVDENASGHVRWMSSQHPGFYLDEHSQTASFEPFQHYVVLRNDQGKRKVIISLRELEAAKMKFAQVPTAKVSKEAWVDQLLTYDVDDKGMVQIPNDGPAMQYLLYLAIHKHDYPLGARVIESLKKYKGTWDSTMGEIAGFFYPVDSLTLNRHPQATALRLQLAVLKLAQTSEPLTESADQMNVIYDYIDYLNQLNNVPVSQRLNVQDERRLLDELTQSTLYHDQFLLLSHRRISLNVDKPGQETTYTVRNRPQIAQMLNVSNEWQWIDADMQAAMEAAVESPREIYFSMRPGVGFLHNFLHNYRVLQTQVGSPQADNILEQIRLCQFDRDPRIQCVRAFLAQVALNPQAFPAYDALAAGELVKTLELPPLKEQSIYDKLPWQAEIPPERIEPGKKVLEPTKVKRMPESLPMTFSAGPDPLEAYADAAVFDERLDAMIDELEAKLEADQREEDLAVIMLESDLNEYSSELLAEREAGLLTPLSLEEAVVAFGQSDDAAFFRANPGLSAKELLSLKNGIGSYLVHKANARLSGQFLQAVKEAQKAKGTDGYAFAKALALKVLDSRRFYIPRQAPDLLVQDAEGD